MLTPVDFEMRSNMYAIVKDSAQYRGIRKNFYNRQKDYHIYDGQAYWIQKKNNVISLAFGQISYEFSTELPMNLENLSEQELMNLAANVKDGQTYLSRVRTHSCDIFGNRTVWSNRHYSDENYRELVETFFNLPKAPDDTYGWMKLVK